MYTYSCLFKVTYSSQIMFDDLYEKDLCTQRLFEVNKHITMDWSFVILSEHWFIYRQLSKIIALYKVETLDISFSNCRLQIVRSRDAVNQSKPLEIFRWNVAYRRQLFPFNTQTYNCCLLLCLFSSNLHQYCFINR